jgi:hypothetical protein
MGVKLTAASGLSVKYEEVYMRACDSVRHARNGLKLYFDVYYVRRPYSSLDLRTPDQVWQCPRQLDTAGNPLFGKG